MAVAYDFCGLLMGTMCCAHVRDAVWQGADYYLSNFVRGISKCPNRLH
jgi:hypothetical protein